jgi:hypothetical protein
MEIPFIFGFGWIKIQETTLIKIFGPSVMRSMLGTAGKPDKCVSCVELILNSAM